MDKPTDSGSPALSALDAYVRWLETDPPQSKHRDSLLLLAAQSRNAVLRGDEPPVADVPQLHEWHRNRFGGAPPAEPVTGKWLPAAQMTTWQDSRAEARRQFLAAAGCAVDVELAIDKGGGRHNQTTYRLRFPALPLSEADASSEAEVASSSGSVGPVSFGERVVYRMEPATPSWLVVPFIGREAFHIRSLRGVLFITMIGLPFPVAVFSAYASAFIVWTKAGAFAAWLGPLAFVATIAAILTWSMRPFWQLPNLRVTIAPEWVVGISQFYAQLRLTRDNDKKLGGRFDLVRFYGSCPICAGTVEIRDGGRAWPGRLVGCCSDSPREHVYGFDAVTLDGKLLIG